MATKGKVLIDMGDDVEIMERLDAYRRSLGWTWKRMFLIGAAEIIAKNKDNPDLVMDVVDYLGGKR